MQGVEIEDSADILSPLVSKRGTRDALHAARTKKTAQKGEARLVQHSELPRRLVNGGLHMQVCHAAWTLNRAQVPSMQSRCEHVQPSKQPLSLIGPHLYTLLRQANIPERPVNATMHLPRLPQVHPA